MRRKARGKHAHPLKNPVKPPLTTGMTAHDPSFARETRGFLRWFGRQPPEPERPPQEPGAPDENQLAHDKRELRRRQLLDDIGSFLLTHRLEVSAYTLAIAHDVMTGTDQRLAAMIEDRVARRQPVTLDWLEQAGRNSGRGDEAAALSALMAKLEESLETFSETTTAARSATTEYNSALEAHVGELEQVSKAGVVISELASIARIMLERTREIEQQMSRSELQTRTLQKNLDDARRKAEIDHLTGLPNRRAFEAVLEREFELAQTAKEPLCVAFCDIDHFKKINDTHGHEAGDRVLRTVAKCLAKISGDTCHVARHGGEEFVVLFRGKRLEDAAAVLDDTREKLAARRLVNRATDIPFGRISFSGGIADVFAHESAREALKAADAALYEAKGRGRNIVLVAPDPA
jgi:diguanylate cyclase